jgi:hypothetical protein
MKQVYAVPTRGFKLSRNVHRPGLPLAWRWEEVLAMEDWRVSAGHLARLMGPGASDRDAEDMADLLTFHGHSTRLDAGGSLQTERAPVPSPVWDACLVALLAVRAR